MDNGTEVAMIYLTLAYFLVGAVVLYWVHRRYAPERDPDVDWWIMLFPDSVWFAVVLLAIWPISVFYVRSEAIDRTRQLRSKELAARRQTEREAEARTQERRRWIGRMGIATSPLRPTGRATFDNEHVEVRSAYQFIEKGENVQVADIDDGTLNRIVVVKATGHETLDRGQADDPQASGGLPESNERQTPTGWGSRGGWSRLMRDLAASIVVLALVLIPTLMKSELSSRERWTYLWFFVACIPIACGLLASRRWLRWLRIKRQRAGRSTVAVRLAEWALYIVVLPVSVGIVCWFFIPIIGAAGR
jgi:hypothetical protein